jgi:hypothetical protein
MVLRQGNQIGRFLQKERNGMGSIVVKVLFSLRMK